MPVSSRFPDHMFQHAPVFGRNDVFQIFEIRLSPFPERHVAGAAGNLGQNFPRHRGVGGKDQSLVVEEALELLGYDRLFSQQVNLGVGDVGIIG